MKFLVPGYRLAVLDSVRDCRFGLRNKTTSRGPSTLRRASAM